MSDTAERKPENFDWVKARAECSSAAIFAKLRMSIEADVEIRNALRQRDEIFFRFVASSNSRFAVASEEPITRMSGGTIVFTVASGAIMATDGTGKDLFVSRPTLGDDGECRLKIGDKTFDLWQIRKMALEDLFFNKAIWNP
jgi:hypothetical protein